MGASLALSQPRTGIKEGQAAKVLLPGRKSGCQMPGAATLAGFPVLRPHKAPPLPHVWPWLPCSHVGGSHISKGIGAAGRPDGSNCQGKAAEVGAGGLGGPAGKEGRRKEGGRRILSCLTLPNQESGQACAQDASPATM